MLSHPAPGRGPGARIEATMKARVLYYSRTGVTAQVARELAGRLGADIEEVRDLASRKGPIGWLTGGRDAMKKRAADIAPLARHLGDYQLLIFGTPVWAWTMTPAIRAALARAAVVIGASGSPAEAPAGVEVAFFCTMGSSGDKRTFAAMAAAIGRQPRATLALTQRQVRRGEFLGLLEPFAARLR